ncbi:lipid catabolic process [Trichomonas vaginalis G3]|uniref:lipid catabolic process n=1 Tax=Trichomonas vaginalis (strain ATCC PRA-98 / G3) TaxID=412133 RepID=UPI0021E56D5A|nr:lipid catabolic process [Trichomonas vaginalis G3]KAI5519929.1 lipid catabolic process [Trichomonas vaginalis G3]
MVGYLISEGADANAKNNEGFTTLHLSADRNYKEMAILLLSQGADINSTTNDEMTALHIAAKNTYSKGMVECLLLHGIDLNIKDKNGKTALQLASEHHKKAVVKLITAYIANNEKSH